jgi:hypothetical protein
MGVYAPASGEETLKLVGIGTANCIEYLQEIKNSAETEKNYIAWAQGYMSGILVRSPVGVDADLDLMPVNFPLMKQAQFLRQFCSGRPTKGFTDAVEELYRTLRTPPG